MLVTKVAIHSRPVIVASLRSGISAGRADADDPCVEDADMLDSSRAWYGPPSRATGAGSARESGSRWTTSPVSVVRRGPTIHVSTGACTISAARTPGAA